jgi:hypothetical protein
MPPAAAVGPQATPCRLRGAVRAARISTLRARGAMLARSRATLGSARSSRRSPRDPPSVGAGKIMRLRAAVNGCNAAARRISPPGHRTRRLPRGSVEQLDPAFLLRVVGFLILSHRPRASYGSCSASPRSGRKDVHFIYPDARLVAESVRGLVSPFSPPTPSRSG